MAAQKNHHRLAPGSLTGDAASPSRAISRARGSTVPAFPHPLGDLTAAEFLAKYWQKKPLLIRSALPTARDLIDRATLFQLARRGDVEARLVQRHKGRWNLTPGPLGQGFARRLPRHDWTLLVQGANHHLSQADALLRAFRFIPYARLDDVMISFAAPGGGVGPHIDSYDVFLLQTSGHRRWRIARARNAVERSTLPDVPLKILRQFTPDMEYWLEPGDMLYLPPGWAHDGVALDHGVTCSIGFRAPTNAELVTQFLQRFGETDPERLPRGLYADPNLRATNDPAAVPTAMIQSLRSLLSSLRFSRSDVSRFLGEYLSEPKPNVIFERPKRVQAHRDFARRCTRTGVQLDRRTLLLIDGPTAFINGERIVTPVATRQIIRKLANQRHLAPQTTSSEVLELIYPWYLAGWLHPGIPPS